MVAWFSGFNLAAQPSQFHVLNMGTAATSVGLSQLKDIPNLRQRALCRLVYIEAPDIVHIRDRPTKEARLLHVKPDPQMLLNRLKRYKIMTKVLCNLPVSVPSTTGGGDPEIHPALQDLAEIMAIEAKDAFMSRYYPSPENIFIPPKLVTTIMAALQREMNREGVRVSREPIKFSDLPKERQHSLCARRRLWFSRVGITRREWKKNKWSLW